MLSKLITWTNPSCSFFVQEKDNVAARLWTHFVPRDDDLLYISIRKGEGKNQGRASFHSQRSPKKPASAMPAGQRGDAGMDRSRMAQSGSFGTCLALFR